MAETLNFTRAAERLRLTQPALSRQIRDLEEELGVLLLERGNGITRLTQSGRKFLTGARRVLADADALVAATRINGAHEPGPLRIGLFGSLVADHAAPFLQRLTRRNPQLRLAIDEFLPVEGLRALRAHEVDAIFTGAPESARLKGLEQRVVWRPRQHIILSATHPLAKRRSLHLHELRHERWCIWDDRAFPGFGQCFLDCCRRAGFRPIVAAQTDSLLSTLIHVATGDRISHAPMLARKVPHPGVVFVPTAPPRAIDIPILLVWNPASAHAAALLSLAEEMEASATAEALKEAVSAPTPDEHTMSPLLGTCSHVDS